MEFFVKDFNHEHRNMSGIYKITNTVNSKVYVGKTVNFRKRYVAYKGAYKIKDIRKINDYLMNSISKYGPEKFTFSIIEICDISKLAELQLKWIVDLQSTDSSKGYNFRMDSSTGMVTHKSTREKISKRLKLEFETGIRCPENISKFFSEFWRDNPEVKAEMAQSVSESRKSFFIKRLKTGEILSVYDGINQLKNDNPTYKWQNVYAACNGNKKSYMGFIWERLETLPDGVEVSSSGSTKLAECPEKSVYQTTNVYRGGLYKYTVEGDPYSGEWLGKDLAKLLPSMYYTFSRLKQDRIKHKGMIITRKLMEALE